VLTSGASDATLWAITRDSDHVESCLRRTYQVCAYCRGAMRVHAGISGCPADKATIEHLNRKGPFYWSSRRLQEKHLVIACGRCNASRGRKRFIDWFDSPYCRKWGINRETVAPRVRQYLRSGAAKR
jgi:hypothetical protein